MDISKQILKTDKKQILDFFFNFSILTPVFVPQKRYLYISWESGVNQSNLRKQLTCFIWTSMCFLAIFSQLSNFYAICAIFTPVQIIMSLTICPHIALVYTPASNVQVVTFKYDIFHLLSTKILKTVKKANFSIFYIFDHVSPLSRLIVIPVVESDFTSQKGYWQSTMAVNNRIQKCDLHDLWCHRIG